MSEEVRENPLGRQSKILFWNRQESQEQEEKIYGDAFINFIYGTQVGQGLAESVLSKAFVSKAYGFYQSLAWSRHKIRPFVEQFQIPMEEFEAGPFRTFNDFFIRKFRSGARSFVQNEREMPAFSEARYLAYERVTEDQKFPVKGSCLSAAGLLGKPQWAKVFEGGPLLLARLCPTDYHRFHFPDSGTLIESYRIPGRLHSVNPIALRFRNEIFITNERQVSILETRNFGKLAYIEVGATCVGKIVQTHEPGRPFNRGDEKGYFLFGASTVIVLGVPRAWKPDADLMDQTSRCRESLVRLGECVATRI